MSCRSCSEDRETYPQLRQRLEQVKYSSGKNKLLVMCSSGISPLKLSLKACRGGGTERISNVHCNHFLLIHGVDLRVSMSVFYTLYLQSLEDDTGRAWRAGGLVIELLLQAAKQAAEICGRVVGPSSSVLNGAECLWEQTQLPETLLEKTVSRFGGFV